MAGIDDTQALIAADVLRQDGNPGEAWTYETPAGHDVGWLSLSHGSLLGDGRYEAGELIAFDRSDAAIPLMAGPEGATFVLGSAVPHPH